MSSYQVNDTSSTPSFEDSVPPSTAESTVAAPLHKSIDENNDNDDNTKSRCSTWSELYRCTLGTAVLIICGCISVALVIATIVLVYTSVANDNNNIGWVNHSTDVRANLALLTAATYATQTAVLSAIIDPGNATYITRFNTNLGYVNGNYSYFQFLTQDNPIQSITHVDTFNQLFYTDPNSLNTSWTNVITACSSVITCASTSDKITLMNSIQQPFQLVKGLILVDPGSACDGTADRCSMLGEETYLLKQRTYTATNEFQVSLETASALLAVVVVCVLIMSYGSIKRQRQTFEHVKVELTQQVEEARKDAKNKSSFLATMSHELRTPMNGVMAMSELLSLTNLTSYQSDLLSTVRASASSMMLLVNDLLMHLKIEAGMFRLLPTPFLLSKFLNDVDRLFSLRASSKGLTFSVVCSDDVPPILVADADRLRQVIINLCDNALKFTDKGSVHVHVQLKQIGNIESRLSETSTRISETSGYMPSPAVQHRSLNDNRHTNGDNTHFTIDMTTVQKQDSIVDAPAINKPAVPLKIRKFAPNTKRELVKSAKETMQSLEHEVGEQIALLQFTVSDTGIGITPEAQQKIWLPFQQADAHIATKYGGTGLGLSIASDLVQLMGGRMSVTSQVNVGTTFNFTIKSPVQYNTDTTDNSDQLPQMNMLLNNIAESSVDHTFSDNGSVQGDLPQNTPPQPLSHILEVTDRVQSHSSNDNDIKTQSLVSNQTAGIYDAALAVADDLQAQASNRTKTRRSSHSSFAGPKLNILLAEDNKTNVKVAINMLKRLNDHDITVASNGLEAVEQYKSGKQFDAILMDVQMPHLDGNQATQEIRRIEAENNGLQGRAISEHDLKSTLPGVVQNGITMNGIRAESTPVLAVTGSRRIPIVCMSASVMDDDVRRAKASGMDLFLSKPLSLSGLESMLNQVTALKQ